MNIDYGYFALTILQILVVADNVRHNKTVDELYPDVSDQKQIQYRIKLEINMYPSVFMLILIVGLFIRSFFD